MSEQPTTFTEQFKECAKEAMWVRETTPDATKLSLEDVTLKTYTDLLVATYPLAVIQRMHEAGGKEDFGEAGVEAIKLLLRDAVEWGFTIGRIFQSHGYDIPLTRD